MHVGSNLSKSVGSTRPYTSLNTCISANMFNSTSYVYFGRNLHLTNICLSIFVYTNMMGYHVCYCILIILLPFRVVFQPHSDDPKSTKDWFLLSAGQLITSHRAFEPDLVLQLSSNAVDIFTNSNVRIALPLERTMV